MQPTVDLIRDERQLTDADVANWNRLASNPFQRWEWLGNWWRAFQIDRSLAVLRVRLGEQTLAYVPWCMATRRGTGRTLQFLGSGKACTDHLSILTRPEHSATVCRSVADWLVDRNEQDSTDAALQWDTIEWIGVDADDRPTALLADSLLERGLAVDRTDGAPCCGLDLPASWDEYVGWRSKRGRREVRQCVGQVDDGRLKIQRVTEPDHLESSWETFVGLHQSRRHALGTDGCFDHRGFDSFLRGAATDLLQSGHLEFRFALSGEVPVAGLFALVDEDCFYLYQSGMQTDDPSQRPGLTLLYHALRESIRQGRRRFDLMRGDEPFKLRVRAGIQPTVDTRIFGNRSSSRLRGQIYRAGVSFKKLIKTGIGNPSSTC